MYHPDTRGFFPLVQVKVEESLAKQELDKFMTLSLEGKLAFVSKLEPVKKIFKEIVQLDYGNKKNKEQSIKNREAGNAQFYAGNYKQAQLLYSVAVITAPTTKSGSAGTTGSNGSEDLSLALANRAAAFQKLKAPKLALSDIDLALETGYPKDKVFKLIERKGECLSVIKQYKESNEAFENALELIRNHSSLSKENQRKFSGAIHKKIEANDKAIKVEDCTNPSNVTEGQKLEVLKPNPKYPVAHESIEVLYHPDRGRYVVAKEDIKIGTTILRECPITYTLARDQSGTHCQHCFAIIKAVVPCLKCSWVCYCSQDCQKAAEQSYHKYECGILHLLIEAGFNCYPMLALRSVCTEGLDKLKTIKDRSEKSGTTSETTSKSYLSTDFQNLYNLTAHEETISQDQWLLRTLVSVFILECLKKTYFFNETDTKEEDEKLVGSVILKLINIFPCNSHDVAEFESPTKDCFPRGAQKNSLGSAVYPTLALFNHSCNPSFMRCNRGNEVICVASKNIKAGEEICENYGLMYTTKTKTERQKILKDHYKFDCICQCCKEDWPTSIDLKENNSGLNARDAKVGELKTLSQNAVNLLIHGSWNDGLEAAEESINFGLKHFSLPILEVSETQIAIWKCLWLKFGNMKQAKMF